ncbi:hypothetical protein [Maricaulis sp.]|uniref:hypothetical protein n=1 Tax=Maricaulis sp. TaxID=1486257 RepID=UPI003A931B9D
MNTITVMMKLRNALLSTKAVNRALTPCELETMTHPLAGVLVTPARGEFNFDLSLLCADATGC